MGSRQDVITIRPVQVFNIGHFHHPHITFTIDILDHLHAAKRIAFGVAATERTVMQTHFHPVADSTGRTPLADRFRHIHTLDLLLVNMTHMR